MNKFWNWIQDSDGTRVLRMEGPIDMEAVWGDEITPDLFRSELEASDGDIIVRLNSPGGNVFAAADIYTMLHEYSGKVTVRIPAYCASAATVIAMAGDVVEMSPVAMMIIHDPVTSVIGNAADLQSAIERLNAAKESIMNAYVLKTGLRRSRIADFMANETPFSAWEAKALGFADVVLFSNKETQWPDEKQEEKPMDASEELHLYSTRGMQKKILGSLGISIQNKVEGGEPKMSMDNVQDPPAPETAAVPVIGMDGTAEDGSVPYLILEKQLECLR